MLLDDKNKRNLEIVTELTEQNGHLEEECEVLRQQPVSNLSIEPFGTGRISEFFLILAVNFASA